jgi:hypothetical protein
MAADVHGKKRKSTTRIMSSDKHGRGKKGKGRQAHRKDAGVLGEAEGGPDRPDFAGDLTGRRGPCRRSWASRVDSSGGDEEEGEAKLLVFSDGRGAEHRSGASVSMAAVVFGAVSLSETCR